MLHPQHGNHANIQESHVFRRESMSIYYTTNKRNFQKEITLYYMELEFHAGNSNLHSCVIGVFGLGSGCFLFVTVKER